ncbi:MAG: YkgJ family cysteine cluster protein [bacterium]|jgi:Fe-S-cluster containining protein
MRTRTPQTFLFTFVYPPIPTEGIVFRREGVCLGAVLTNPDEIRRAAERMEAEYLDFRRYLKAHHCPLEPLHEIAAEVESQIDCTACANCCRHGSVTVTEADIAAIAEYLGTTREEVIRLYTVPDPAAPHPRLLASTKQGCTFLDGTLCLVYEARPRACREFPYASHRERSLGGRMERLCAWAALCPIVFNALELYKERVGYRRRPASAGGQACE